MRVFHCDHCGHLIFFENTSCVSCGHPLAFLPALMQVGSLDPGEEDRWTSPRCPEGAYRLCANYREAQVCNWAVDAADPNPLCLSCRLTTVIPDLSVDGHKAAWFKLEAAKRRVVYTLLTLGLPQDGLSYRMLADAGPGEPPVLTGHADGVITLNIAEADDAERERRRHALGEPYRTLLGHIRHEVGHFYWSTLIEPREDRLAPFRERFGDERADYAAALQRHYADGAPADWQKRFVSAYASAHPWEDWAETWAHYLHMIDTLETAATCGVSLKPTRRDEPSLARVPETVTPDSSFDGLLASWFPVTYLLNNLNRGMGVADAYPFVLAPPVIEKLRFVNDLVAEMVRATDRRIPGSAAIRPREAALRR
jgi:hypothetical protein